MHPRSAILMTALVTAFSKEISVRIQATSSSLAWPLRIVHRAPDGAEDRGVYVDSINSAAVSQHHGVKEIMRSMRDGKMPQEGPTQVLGLVYLRRSTIERHRLAA